MAGVILLDQIVTVSPRFNRSIALVRDFDRPDALEGYVLTPTGREHPGPAAWTACAASRRRGPGRLPDLTGRASRPSPCSWRSCLAGPATYGGRRGDSLPAWTPPEAERLFGAGSALARNGTRLFPVLVSGRVSRWRRPGRALGRRLSCPEGQRPPPAFVVELERLAEQP